MRRARRGRWSANTASKCRVWSEGSPSGWRFFHPGRSRLSSRRCRRGAGVSNAGTSDKSGELARHTESVASTPAAAHAAIERQGDVLRRRHAPPISQASNRHRGRDCPLPGRFVASTLAAELPAPPAPRHLPRPRTTASPGPHRAPGSVLPARSLGLRDKDDHPLACGSQGKLIANDTARRRWTFPLSGLGGIGSSGAVGNRRISHAETAAVCAALLALPTGARAGRRT